MKVAQCLTAVAVLAVAVVPARSQAPQVNSISALKQYLHSKSNRNVIDQVIRMQVGRYPGACTDIEISSEFRVTLLLPVQFDGQRFRAGAWKETVQATSCGKSRVHNVQTDVRPDGNLLRSPMLPGSTGANLQLQNDAARAIYASVAIHAKDCPVSQYFIEDTKFLRWDSKRIPNAKAGPDARAWDEEWTASACGKPMVLSVRFTPDAKGTGFVVQMKKK
jgi:hypothetical protein